MSVEPAFEVIKLISEFTILLISITITAYAISASFLGKEYAKTLRVIKEERERAETKLSEKIKSGEISKFTDIEQNITSFKEKENQLKGRIRLISLSRVVVFPNFFFGASLILCAIAIYYYPNSLNLVYLLEVILISVGLLVFSRALIGIQKVSQELEGE